MGSQWAEKHFDTKAVFIMTFSGDIRKLSAKSEFDAYEKIAILSHGCDGGIGGLSAETFSQKFTYYHQSTPKEIRVFSCYSAKKPSRGSSVLTALQNKYQGIEFLEGYDSAIKLAGNGNSSIKDFRFGTPVKHYEKPADNFDYKNLKHFWEDLHKVSEKAPDAKLKDYCTDLFKAITLPTKSIEEFRKQVIDVFSEKAFTGGTVYPPHNFWRAYEKEPVDINPIGCGMKKPVKFHGTFTQVCP